MAERARVQTRLVSVSLHPPYEVNDRPGCYRLAATLLFSPQEYFDTGEAPLRVGLRQASLAMVSEAYQYADNSLIGDAARPYPGVSVGADGEVTVRAPEGAMLAGNPLDEHHLGVIEPAGDGEARVEVRLTAPPYAFTAVLLDSETGDALPTPAPSVAKERILALVYGEAQAAHRDETGRLRLGLAVVRRAAGA